MSRKKTLDEVIAQFQQTHGDRYDYSRVVYRTAHEKVEIICKKHGPFWQRANDHYQQGKGCWDCSYELRAIKTGDIKRKSPAQFIEDAIKIHGNRYDYSLVEYKGSFTKIKIICKTHGIFLQAPSIHLGGANCKKCSNRISKPEKAWLDSLDIPERQHPIRVNKRLRHVDGYDPETNTVYEFHGDFWHGNIAVFPEDEKHPHFDLNYGELYQKTLNKDNDIIDFGFNLIVLWENDWKLMNNMKGHGN